MLTLQNMCNVLHTYWCTGPWIVFSWWWPSFPNGSLWVFVATSSFRAPFTICHLLWRTFQKCQLNPITPGAIYLSASRLLKFATRGTSCKLDVNGFEPCDQLLSYHVSTDALWQSTPKPHPSSCDKLFFLPMISSPPSPIGPSFSFLPSNCPFPHLPLIP